MAPPPERAPDRTPETVTLTCPAKVNLALAVGRTHPDDASGLHPIASWMVAVDFGDRLTVTRISKTDADPPASVFSLRFADDAPSPRPIDWPLESDLVFRAHRLVEQHVKRRLPVRVELDKRIPTGAGLGGGSSDAAGMILALDELFDLRLDVAVFSALAGGLGSDVHFALASLRGEPSALVTGSGEELSVAALDVPLNLVLVLPPFGCPTGPVYAAWDRLAAGAGASFKDQAVEQLSQSTPGPSTPLFNDLERAAVAVEPKLGALLGALRGDLGLPAHVTGSGAACFVLANNREAAEKMAARITAQTVFPAVAAGTLPRTNSSG